MQNILDLHQALRRPITSKVNYADSGIVQGILREKVKKNDLLIGQRQFADWTESTRVQDTANFPEAYYDVQSGHKLIEFAGDLWFIRGQRGGATYATSPQSLAIVYRYNHSTDTWTAIFNVPGRFSADRTYSVDAAIFQGTLWFAVGHQDESSRNDNFVSVFYWNGTTFVFQADLDGTPSNSSIAQEVRDLSMVVYNDRLFLTTASNTGSSLYAYNGQTWTFIQNHVPVTADQKTSKLIVFEDDLYWCQTNVSNNTNYISRYLRNDNPTSTSYQWQYNYRNFDTGRANWHRQDIIVHNNMVFFLFQLDHHTRIHFSPNMHDFYRMYSTGNWHGRLGEDYKDGINSQMASVWHQSSDGNLYMILGGTADRAQWFKIHDSTENVDYHERYSIQYLEYGPDVGPDLYSTDFIEYQGYLHMVTNQADNRPRFYRMNLYNGTLNNGVRWTPAFRYTRNDDYEINHYEADYSWMQQRPRGVAYQIHEGDLYKAMTSVYYPYLITWKFVNNKWQKIADPDILPYGDVRTCEMEVYNNELYLAVANWNGTPRTLTYKWTGVAWSKLIDLSPIYSESFGVSLKSFGGRLYLAVANYNQHHKVQVYYFDGIIWTYTTNIPSYPNSTTYRVSLEEYSGQLYMAMAAGSSSSDIYFYRLNSDLVNWTSLTSAIVTQPSSTCYEVDLKTFNGNLYMAANSSSVSRIYKWNGSQMIEMTQPPGWYNASSRHAIQFFEYKNRLYLLRGDNGAAPYFSVYSLVDEANGVWKTHNRWKPSWLTHGGYAQLQIAAIEFENDAYISFVNDADNHRPGMQDLRIAPPGLIKVSPRHDIKDYYGVAIANEDGELGDTINITLLTPDYNLYKDNGWEHMTWQI